MAHLLVGEWEPWLTEVHTLSEVTEKTEEQQAGEALGESKLPPATQKGWLQGLEYLTLLPIHNTTLEVRDVLLALILYRNIENLFLHFWIKWLLYGLILYEESVENWHLAVKSLSPEAYDTILNDILGEHV